MKIYETESQALAAQINSSDVARRTEGSCGNHQPCELARATAHWTKPWPILASVIDTLVLRHATTLCPAPQRRIGAGLRDRLIASIYLAACDRRCNKHTTPGAVTSANHCSYLTPQLHHSALANLYAIEETP